MYPWGKANPLSRPRGIAPGFDPTHPGLRGFFPPRGMHFVATSNGLINVLGGAAPSGVGTINSSLIGPTLGSLVTVASPFGTATPLNMLAAAIIIPTVSAAPGPIIMTESAAANGNDFELSSLVATWRTGGQTRSSGMPAMTLNQPYFVAATMDSNGASAGAQYWVQRNLATGVTNFAITAILNANSAATATWGIGSADGLIACASLFLFSGFRTSSPGIADLLMWAADPWSFWYPQPDEIFVGASAGSVGTVTGAATVNGVPGMLGGVTGKATATAVAGMIGSVAGSASVNGVAGFIGSVTGAATIKATAGFIGSAAGAATVKATAGFIGSVSGTSALKATAGMRGTVAGAASLQAIAGFIGTINGVATVSGVSLGGSAGTVAGAATLQGVAGFLGLISGAATVAGVSAPVGSIGLISGAAALQAIGLISPLFQFPSNRDPALMITLAYTPAQALLWDEAYSGGFFVLVKPSTLYQVSPALAAQWFGLNATGLKTIYNPFPWTTPPYSNVVFPP